MIVAIDGNEANVENRVGSGVYAFELLKQFSLNKKHNFYIYLKNRPLPHLPKETKNFRYKIFGPKKMWTQFALPLNLLFDRKTDVFFSLGHYGPRFSEVPYCITIFDLSYLYYPDLFKKNDLYQLQKWSSYSIKKSTHIFAISGSTKDDIIKYYGVNPSKISVTYLGYHQERFNRQSKKSVNGAKKRYKISGDYIIFVGTLQPRKNIERLIETFSKLVGNYQLVIVGRKGWLYDSIFEKVKELNLEDQVVFTGYVPDSDMPALIGGAKVYVLPSLWEGFGIPIIEAQACGVPVVASNTSSLPEILDESGILVNPENVGSIANGIKKVLTDDKLRQDLIKKGFKNIKRFSWRKCADQTVKILEKVVSA